jgi:AraC-like DNA-binding protein
MRRLAPRCDTIASNTRDARLSLERTRTRLDADIQLPDAELDDVRVLVDESAGCQVDRLLDFLATSNVGPVLERRSLLSSDGLELHDVRCHHARGSGTRELHTGRHALVFVRRGCFVRHSDGIAATLDPTLAYFLNPGVEDRYDHPHGGGDDCTAIFVDSELAASTWGGDPSLPDTPVPTSPAIDVQHRMLIAATRAGEDGPALVERAVDLMAGLLEQADVRRVMSGRPSTWTAWKQLSDGVREALVANPDLSLVELGRLLAVSPHHLSRVFRSMTGYTIARYRMRIRTRAVFERLAGGERSLARLAAELGFVDQSHLARVVRSETSLSPSTLRELLA